MNIFKILALLILALVINQEAHAKINIISISGVSRSEIDEPESTDTTSSDSAEIFAGTANVMEADPLTGNTDCDGTGTCNTCTGSPELFSACNQEAVHIGTVLSITFSSDNTSGRAIMTDTDDNDINGTTPQVYTAGSTVTLTVEWNDLCTDFATGIDTQKCENATGEFYVGIDSNNDGAIDDKAEINFEILDLDDNDVDNVSFDGSIYDGSSGVEDYTLFPGDNKAYLDDEFPLSASSTLENGSEATALAFYSVAELDGNDLGCDAADIAELNNSLNYIEVSLDDEGVVENDKLEDNLENEIRYVTTLGLIDKAGNVGNFFDTAAAGACVEDQHTVRPREVTGLLSQNTSCFISTAAFGSKFHSKVNDFRVFRDKILRQNSFGKAFVRMYYKYSPPIAKVIAKSETLRFLTRAALLPMWLFSVTSLEIGVLNTTLLFLLALGFLAFLGTRIYHATAITKNFLQMKPNKKKLFSFLIVFIFLFGISSKLSAQENNELESGFFDINEENSQLPDDELPPQEPPYTGNEIEEFDKIPSDPEDPYASGNVPQTPQEIEAEYKQNPNKWKDPQRVPEEDRLKELADDGLFKISKKGEYLYKVKPSEQVSAASVRAAMVTFPELENPENGALFEDIYGSDSKIMLMADYEWQFFQSLGKLGIKLATGLLVADGQGQLSEEVVRPDGSVTSDAKEDFMFFFFPNTLSAIYRLQLFDNQWLVPFGEIGISYFTFIESEEQGDEIKFGGAPHLNFALGGSFLLDVLGRDLIVSIDRDYGVNHLWLTAEYRHFEYLSGDFDFTDDIFSAGIMVEF